MGMAIAMALLAGCAAPRANTPSGANEVTIKAPMRLVRDRFSSAIVDKGYTITRTDDLMIEARKDAGMGAAILLATPADPSAVKIARANLIETDSGVRIILRVFLVAGGRDQGEVTGGRSQTQDWLDELKQKIEAEANQPK